MLPNDIIDGKCLGFKCGRQTLTKLINSLDTIKSKVVHLLKQKDKGVRGALISFQDDNDSIALKNRIMHKVMASNG